MSDNQLLLLQTVVGWLKDTPAVGEGDAFWQWWSHADDTLAAWQIHAPVSHTCLNGDAQSSRSGCMWKAWVPTIPCSAQLVIIKMSAFNTCGTRIRPDPQPNMMALLQ